MWTRLLVVGQRLEDLALLSRLVQERILMLTQHSLNLKNDQTDHQRQELENHLFID
jgi:hypothetical protein